MNLVPPFKQFLQRAGLAVILGWTGLSPSLGATLFYGGDANGGSETNVQVAMFYDDFSLASTTDIGAIWGNYVYTGLAAETAYYEIRSGVTAGNSGTLVASDSAAAIVTPTGRSFFGDVENRVAVNVSFNLTPGTYWVGLVPYGGDIGVLGLMTTSGDDVGPVIDPNPAPTGSTVGNGSSFFSPSYVNSASIVATSSNFSYGLSTTSIPEPGPIGFLLGGMLLFQSQIWTRRRRS